MATCLIDEGKSFSSGSGRGSLNRGELFFAIFAVVVFHQLDDLLLLGLHSPLSIRSDHCFAIRSQNYCAIRNDHGLAIRSSPCLSIGSELSPYIRCEHPLADRVAFHFRSPTDTLPLHIPDVLLSGFLWLFRKKFCLPIGVGNDHFFIEPIGPILILLGPVAVVRPCWCITAVEIGDLQDFEVGGSRAPLTGLLTGLALRADQIVNETGTQLLLRLFLFRLLP
jgi:hypothetical protein